MNSNTDTQQQSNIYHYGRQIASSLPSSNTSVNGTLQSTTSSAMKIVVRFQLSSGERLAIPAELSSTLDQLKEKLWLKKQLQADRKKFVIRLLNGEIFF